MNELLEKYKEHNVEIIYHGGYDPCQVRAKIEEYQLYYRARPYWYSVCVADTIDNAMKATDINSEGVIYFLFDDRSNRNHTAEDVYTYIIEKAIDFTLLQHTMKTMTLADFYSALTDVVENIMKKDK